MAVPWKELVELVTSMKENGYALDSCCRRRALYKEAAQVFDEMKAAGFEPDKVTFNSLLDVYGEAQRHDDAIEVIVEMERVVCPPSVVTYTTLFNSLISSYVKDGMLEEAVERKQEMELKRIKPDEVTYTTLISGLDGAG
ncbi:hypothetical protein ABZP36_001033 [Zizania latifolia]